ncbi:MAG: asparagine synthase (glutamine-hydrolyzing) [Phycisphaerales bacterium]
MCGLVGILCAHGHRSQATRGDVVRMRDALAHRGPDDAGVLVWPDAATDSADSPSVLLAHRRLSVIDPGPSGHQPMTRGHSALIYNGELYNDAELRKDHLAAFPDTRFETTCDTETILHMCLARSGHDWRVGEVPRLLRGMHALCYVDMAARKALLSRDPLGIKPLYYCISPDQRELAFASEAHALFEHPAISPTPDMLGVASYLVTIRTTLGHRTMFEGVRTLEPGESIEVDFSGPRLRLSRRITPIERCHVERPVEECRAVVEDSVRRHLRSDVPVCCLLSGGLDSTILTSVSRETFAENAVLRTYVAGAAGGDDLDVSTRVARALGTHHATAVVTREMFVERWRWLVEGAGVPLSTPNEVAIYEVARRLREDGVVVALSGEGADELFAGYHLLMEAVAREAGDSAADRFDGGMAMLRAASWLPASMLGEVLSERALREAESGRGLMEWYRGRWEELSQREASPLQVALRMLRRINLEGLLTRLDSSMMRAGVEGRTPLADVRVAAFAESLSMGDKYDGGVEGAAGTKVVLRRAFADCVPGEVLTRAKASFPLPFQEWMVGAGLEDVFAGSPAREWFTEAAWEALTARDAARRSIAAWPVANVAMWAGRWWG